MDIQNLILKLLVNIIPIISAVYIIVGIILFRSRSDAKASYFSMLMFASAIYSFGYFLELNCFSIETLLAVRNFEYLGAVFVPAFGILFIADLTKSKISNKIKILLYSTSMCLWIIFITNPLHSLIYKSIYLLIVGSFGITETVKGPLFYSMVLFYAVFLIYSSMVLQKAYRKAKKNNLKKGFLFLLVSLQIPWIAILIIIMGLDKYIDPTPATIIIICILIGVNEIKNGIFEFQIDRWENSFANTDYPAFLVDRNGVVTCTNSTTDKMFSGSVDEISNTLDSLDHCEQEGKPFSFMIDDEINWFNVKKNSIDTKRRLTNYVLVNVTESKKAENTLRESETRLIDAQRMAHVGSWELNMATKAIWGSEEAFNIYGIKYDSQYLPLEIVQECVLKQYRKALDAELEDLITMNKEYDIEFKISKNDSKEERDVRSKARLLFDENGSKVKVIGTIQDITDHKKREEKISYLSYHDQLTGLYNRRFYEEELVRLDTEEYLPLTIVMGDVNGLKLINDSFGHFVGDELLIKVAEVIFGTCRSNDIVARLGGDEFVMIFPNTDVLETEKIIRRIKGEMAKEKVRSLEISVSFGFETKHLEAENINEIIKNTEDHMYKHKLYEGSSMRSKTIDLIMSTLYEKNNREMLHSKRVSKLCEEIAAMMGFDKDEINQIGIAGLMHDIGKIGIDENILNKPDKLNNEEWKEIKRHSEIGYRILSSVNEFSEIADYVLEHQERWDGKGYPKGLIGEAISIQARIIAVADSFDAMTTVRTYGTAFTIDEAKAELKRCAGSQFDPVIVDIFIGKASY